MWAKKQEKDYPVVEELAKLWLDEDEDEEEWKERLDALPKKYMRVAASDYHHDFVVHELCRWQDKDFVKFDPGEASPARVPEDLVQRMPELGLEDLEDSDDEESFGAGRGGGSGSGEGSEGSGGDGFLFGAPGDTKSEESSKKVALGK